MTPLQSGSTPRVAVVGSFNMDLVFGAPRMPERGETISGSAFGMFIGGKGANQAVAAARAGAHVEMIGRIGSDSFGQEVTSAGDLYYWPGGHTGWTDEGVTFVEFSPADAIKPVLEHLAAQLSASS